MGNNNVQAALQMADNAARQVTSSYQEWTAFLSTAGRLYKYPFPEQLMIYTQRPEATACAEWDFWNQRMRRYIRRGSKGIVLLDTSRGRPALRYVFDVADTSRKDEKGLNPNLWQYREEHRDAVTAALESRFEVSGADGLAEQLEQIAAQLANEYWTDHQYDILHIVDGSFLEEYDEFNIGAAFRNAAAVSIAYTLLSRCGLEPETHFQHEDFLSIFDFNTRNAVTALGMAVSQSSEQVLRQIERTVKQYERTKGAERSTEHEERADLHPGGGLPVSQRGPAGTAGPGPGQVREDAPAVLEGTSPGPVGGHDDGRDPVQPPVGDRGHSQQPVGGHDAPAGEGGGGHGAAESHRPDEVGGTDEQLQGPGGGNYFVGTGLQLSFMPPAIPSQREQLEAIQEAESADAPSAFSIPQAEVDRALREYSGRLKIFELYQQDLPARSIAAAIRKEYGTGGGSFTLSDGSHVFLDYRPNTGLEFWKNVGDEKFVVKWAAVEKRIRQMVEEGSYLSTAEMEKYLSDHLEEAPAEGITQADINRVLLDDWGAEGRKQRIFAQYQDGRSNEEIAAFLREEYQRGGYNSQNSGFVTLADGSKGYSYFVYAELRLRRNQNDSPMRYISFEELAGHIRALIDEGRYLAPEELAQVRGQEAPAPEESLPMPDSAGFLTEYEAIKAAHPGDIVLYQLGDFYEMFGPDARVAHIELDLMLTNRNHPGLGRVAMCGIPGHRLDEYVQKLRERHDVTVSSIGAGGERLTVSYPAVGREAVGSHETEAPAPEEAAPVHVPGAAPPIPASAPAQGTAQGDIDAALQAWNGDADSKRRVQQYMTDHAREKDTAAWLRTEYGGDLPMFPVQLPGAGQYQHLPWAKVQRRIAQLVQKDLFLSHEEQSPAPEQLPTTEQAPVPEPAPTVRQIYETYKPKIKGFVLTDGPYQNACLNSDRDTAVLEGHEAVTRAAMVYQEPDFMRLYFGMAGFRNRLHREIIDETYPVLSQPQQEQAAVPDLSGQPVTRDGDTITIGDGPAVHEVDITVSDGDWQAIQDVIPGAADQPPHDPLAPAYAPGDTVYLNDTAFEITGIGLLDVELRDPALPIPLFRTESKENFERLLHMDPRNDRIVQYLPADMNRVNDDFREVLASHLLTDRDKGYISGWLRSGENNRGIAQRLSLAFASRAETVTLETGDIADYFTSTTSMAVEIQDKFGTKLALSWEAVAPILRAMYQQELDGFTHEPPQREPVTLEGKLSYQVGDKVAFPFGDHEVNGTIGYIGEIDVRIDTGPYAWSHQTVTRDFFEDAVRHDERNAGLFSPEAPEQEVPETAAAPGTAMLYPGDKNGLPYDIIVQTLNTGQPEQAQPEAAPATENFRITDDHLGEGGPRAKFRMNMEAINTLQAIELEGRTATPAEQEVLSRYVGWGGLPQAFDENNGEWTNEFLELQAALTPEEYASARKSTLNAHYSRPAIIKAIYEAVENMGFKAGNILEPSCGIGNFFGLLPESMAASKLYGVELDSISGRIAQQLYPKANIAIRGFEKSGFPDGFFDLAIGNVPFGNYSLVDRRYDREHLLIHDYFFAKTIDAVRAGGVIAFVTSNGISGGTMDKKDRRAREYIARRCDLLGAVRLPSNASLANAGTEAGMDIVFLQKRDMPRSLNDPLPEWTEVDTLEEHTYTGGDGKEKRGFVTMNRYFQAHPEMVLGNLEITSGPFGPQLECRAIPDADLAQQLHEAVSHIHGEYREAAPPELDENIGEMEITAIPADPGVKNYSYAIVEGEVYYRENSVMVKPALTASAKERVTAMIGLRDCVRQLIDLQMDEYVPDSAIREKQTELDRLYDAFSAKFGLVNDRANRLAFDRDSSYYLLCSLEVLDDDGRLERKADMFTKRTIKQNTRVTSVDTAMDALAVSIGERAKVDMPFMAQLAGKSEAELEQELTGVIFRDIRCAENPDHIPKAFVDLDRYPLVTADEYLSGNVRQKLRMAQALYDVTPPAQQQRIRPNVEALTAAQPKDLDASEIEVRLGTDWIDKRYIQQFMYETLKTPSYLRGKIKVNHSKHTTEWAITCKGSVSDNDVAAYTTYGTSRANAYRILEDSLNLRDVRIYDTVVDPDGRERRVLNAKETTLAAQKQQALREAFKDWIWKDPRRRQTLVAQYNEEMNCIRPREYDGSRIVFSGINPEIKLQPHQVNAVAHVLYGGNTLLAHEVGAGKTFEMIAAAMESKRLGLCHKSIFVVPNHLTEQTASEFLRLYPSANILVTTKKDFEARKRKKFCARIATGDYDAVIIGHSQFEKIPISPERQERLLQEQIWEITDGIQELEGSAERFTVKQLERTKRQLEARLEKLQANHRKDDVVTFEQLGVDMMFVDESDNYKNLFLYTKMRNVAGLATTDAQKSSDMFAKCRYLDEITKGRGIVFATGTPISNSMTEMYSIQRYLQYDRLQEMGMTHFDSWASRFGETTTALELAPEGTGYRPRTRFAKFFNLPELMNLFKEVADIKTADQLNLPTPEVEYHTVASQPTTIQQAMVKELSQRASEVHTGRVDPRRDNMLKITSDGRKLGLDQRVIDPMLPDEPGTKVNCCVENILQQWRDGDGKRLTQLVFCDISTPKPAPSKRAVKGAGDKLDDPTLHMLESAIPLEPEKPFTIYEDIRQKLIAGGMRPEQVAFIHEAKTDVQKKELFAKVRSGQVRVLMGSTFKMGAGTNVQDKLIALHDLDCPWRPRDLTQRKGRIERRGNDNKKVHVYRYVTEATFDAYLWQTVENKQKFISQIMTSKSPARTCEDVDEAALSYAEIKALCAGDPRIKERMELDVDVSKLKIMKSAHQSQQFQMEDNLLKYFPEQIAQHQGFIKGLEADMNTLAEHPHPLVVKEKPSPAQGEQAEAGTEAPAVQTEAAEGPAAAVETMQGFAGMVVQGQTFTDKEEAGKALLSAYMTADVAELAEIGSYRGFTMFTEVRNFQRELVLKGEMTHRTPLGTDPFGALARIDHTLAKIPERLAAVKVQLENLFDQREAAKAEVGKPFPREDELKEKSARLAELDVLLNIDGGARPLEDIAKSPRPSVLDGLKRPLPPRTKAPDKSKRPQQER